MALRCAEEPPFKLDNGSDALIYWNAVNLLTSTYEGTVTFRVFGRGKKISLIGLRDGGIYEFPPEMCEDLGEGGVRLRNIPLTDCPLSLIFE